MIVLDIETSGLDTGKCGIWQIGAIDLETREEFLEEGRIDEEDKVEEGALRVTGKTEEELRNEKKQSQKQLILNFLEWVKNFQTKIIIGQNIGFDMMFMQTKCIRYGIQKEFRETIGSKGLDTYTIAQIKHLEKKGNYSLKENGVGDMSLGKVLEFCGLVDNRMELSGTKVVKKGTPHNALEDCKLEAEAFSRLIYGKNLLPEFKEFEIPDYLIK